MIKQLIIIVTLSITVLGQIRIGMICVCFVSEAFCDLFLFFITPQFSEFSALVNNIVQFGDIRYIIRLCVAVRNITIIQILLLSLTHVDKMKSM